MELPKNVTQVGETDKSCKIYMEDYVMSYLKQMNRFAEDKEIAIALYGKCSLQQEVSYCFVYGAGKLDYVQKVVKHFSQAQNQEVERLRRKYFPECEFVGYLILNGEMIEGIHISEPNGCRYIKGYACFYEKNDNMLAYMLDNRASQAPTEEVEQEKYEQVKKRQEERRIEYAAESERQAVGSDRQRPGSEIEKNMRNMRFAAASMFVLLCLVSVVTLQTEGLGQDVSAKIKNLFGRSRVHSQVEGESLQAMSDDTINTLVAEEQLAQAIRQENQKSVSSEEVVSTSGEAMPVGTQEPIPTSTAVATAVPTSVPAPTLAPMPAQTPQPTAIPTQIPTMEPTPIPTIEPTAVPVQTQKVYNSYVIRSGDTLIGISSSLYGSEEYVDAICKLNNISNPDNIQIGQKILLP